MSTNSQQYWLAKEQWCTARAGRYSGTQSLNPWGIAACTTLEMLTEIGRESSKQISSALNEKVGRSRRKMSSNWSMDTSKDIHTKPISEKHEENMERQGQKCEPGPGTKEAEIGVELYLGNILSQKGRRRWARPTQWGWSAGIKQPWQSLLEAIAGPLQRRGTVKAPVENKKIHNLK